MKLTKIVATIGPASSSRETLIEMMKLGVNVFRFNFKHNDTAWHKQHIQLVNSLANHLNMHVSTLLDLQGPSIRVELPVEKVDFVAGELLPFGEVIYKENVKGISISHPHIIPHLKIDEEVFFADGTISFFLKKKGEDFFLAAKNSGTLQNKKNVNIPTSHFPLPVLIERDFEGLQLAAEEGVDFIALSFVRSAQDIIDVKKEMKKFDLDARIISKIETMKSLDLINEIIDETDGIMIARGDLGVEIPIYEVPYYQKLIIGKCVEKGVPVIVATQMIESMITSPLPTRAEISDIANATYDLTDAVMLSGESAFGEFPLEAVSMMARTVTFNEDRFLQDTRLLHSFITDTPLSKSIEKAYELYLKQFSKSPEKLVGFIVFSQSGLPRQSQGQSAQLLSQFRPGKPIFAFTQSEKVSRVLTLSFGVTPIILDSEDVETALIEVKKFANVNKGDTVIVINKEQEVTLLTI